MDTQGEVGTKGQRPVPYTEENSADWWQSRTSDELREFISRGFSAGQLFTLATAEAARRNEEGRRLADLEASAVSVRLQTRRKRFLTAAGLLLFGATLALALATAARLLF